MFFGRSATVDGHLERVNGAMNVPPPLRSGGPPIMRGGGERRLLKPIARHADAWNAFGDVETIRHKIAVLDGHCADEGRDPATIQRTVLAGVAVAVAVTTAEAEARVRAASERAGLR